MNENSTNVVTLHQGAAMPPGTGPFPADSPMYVPVSSRTVSVADAAGDPKANEAFQAVVRDDTGEVLGIHGKSYKIIPNEPLYRGFDEALQKSEISLDGLVIEDHVNYGGRRVIRDYRFPLVKAEPRVGDIVELKVTVINSFDSFNAFSAQVGGMRLWCKNGAVSLHGAASVYGRHTSGFDNVRAVAKINQALEQYLLNASDWAEWAGRDIDATNVKSAVEAFPDVNDTMLKRLMKAWDIESEQSGDTVWALYNALTRWSTHTPVRTASEPNRASIVLDRERRVRQFMRGPTFKRLAA